MKSSSWELWHTTHISSYVSWQMAYGVSHFRLVIRELKIIGKERVSIKSSRRQLFAKAKWVISSEKSRRDYPHLHPIFLWARGHVEILSQLLWKPGGSQYYDMGMVNIIDRRLLEGRYWVHTFTSWSRTLSKFWCKHKCNNFWSN